jgi:hypothetical protein
MRKSRKKPWNTLENNGKHMKTLAMGKEQLYTRNKNKITQK